ncbi:MAG: GNAT family N-acetyltransferase [Phycisphaeraceae bacterium]|nr:MAG: GNAT family N-acetyltransferase [Phycisphaeraceae bacterium]
MSTVDAVQIQRAGVEDIETVVPLFEAYRAYYRADADAARAGVFITERIRNADSVVFVARVGDEAVGFVQLFPKYSSVNLSREWILNDLFVAPEHRRKGYADALMGAAEAFARSTGAAKVTLKTELTNESARALYESRGWRADEVFVTYALRFRDE